MRLHPAKDGLIPMPDERGLSVRDRGGNRLVDVYDPTTGFCVGVTSPLSTTGMSVFTPKPPSSGHGPDVRFDTESNRYYELIRESNSDPIGIVVRLDTDGDTPLPCARVRVIQAKPSASRKSERNSTAPVQKKPSVRKQNDEAVRAVLSAHGYKGPITPQIRKVCLELIAMERHVSGS